MHECGAENGLEEQHLRNASAIDYEDGRLVRSVTNVCSANAKNKVGNRAATALLFA